MDNKETLKKALDKCADIRNGENYFFLATGWMFCNSCGHLHCFPESEGENGGVFHPTVEDMVSDEGFLKAFFGDEWKKHRTNILKDPIKYLKKHL